MDIKAAVRLSRMNNESLSIKILYIIEFLQQSSKQTRSRATHSPTSFTTLSTRRNDSLTHSNTAQLLIIMRLEVSRPEPQDSLV